MGSDDDLLDFESDDADAPNLANVISRDKHQRTKLRSRVSSEVYRLEQNVRRSREENEAMQNRKGRHISRNSGSRESRRSGSFRRSIQEASSSEVSPPENLKRRTSGSRSFSGRKSIPASQPTQQEPRVQRSSSRSRQQETKDQPRPTQPEATLSLPPPQEGPADRRRASSFRRLSDMSPEEKALEKQRLQALVKEFAREAVGGFDITLVDVERDRTAPATFSMDRHLLVRGDSTRPSRNPPIYDVTIDSRDESQVPSAHFSVGSLTGAFKAEDFYSGGHIQPPSSFDPSIALVLTTKESACPKVVVVFSGRRERDKAYTCLKILRLSVDLAKK